MARVADVPPRVRVRMAPVWAVLFLAVAVSGRWSSGCRTFREEHVAPGTSKEYRCPAEKCSRGQVYGTDVYTEDSDICLSALHSGVVTSLAANITIRRLSAPQPVLGTARNRIVSRSKHGAQHPSVYTVETTAQQEGVVGEVMLVYSFINKRNDIRFICLSQDQQSPISSRSLRTWNYENTEVGAESGENSPILVFKSMGRDNRHAVRLLGSRSDEDVLATVQYPDAEYQALVATVRASSGDNVTIDFLVKDGRPSGSVYIRRLPEEWPSRPSHELPLRLSPARPSDSGIYIVHDSKNTARRGKKGAYFNMLIRRCGKGFFGDDCAQQCPPCLNGGQCHDRRGTCLCAPGFIGERCQYACPPGFFGNECQFECRGRGVALGAPQRTEERTDSEAEESEEEDGRCRGFTMCLPPPYGCSCAAGFKHPDLPGASCTQSCPKGLFGANCDQRCDGCQGEQCHAYSGTCTRGCRRGHSCKQGPPRPGLVLTPLHRGYEASWSAAPDSQARYIVSQQLLRLRGCPLTTAREPRRRFQTVATPSLKAQSLQPYTAYNVCVVASTAAGLSAPDCLTVDTLQEAPERNVTHAGCYERYYTLHCTAQVTGGCNSGPNETIKFSLHSQLSCPHPLATLQEYAELRDSYVTATFEDYLPGVTYTGKAELVNAEGTGRAWSFRYTTRPKAPPPVRNVTHAVLSDSTALLLWNDPCPPNGVIDSIYVEGEYISVQPCASTDQYDRCHTVSGLERGKEYHIGIHVMNRYTRWTPRESYTFIFEEKEPGPPQAIGMTRGARTLNLTLVSPLDPGGTLRNCSITLTHSSKSCVIKFAEGTTPAPCSFLGLTEGKTEEAVARCCNTGFCGGDLRQRVATLPLPPLLGGSLHVVRKTNTTITLRFPSVTRKRDGNISVIVFVQVASPHNALDLRAEVRRLFETQRHKTRAARSASGREGRCGGQVWIAAQLDQNKTEFVIGDGNTYGSFENCPLKRGNAYDVGVMGVNELLGATVFSDPAVKEAVVVEPCDPSSYRLLLDLLLGLRCLLLVLNCLGLLLYYRLYSQLRCMKV